MTIEGVATMRLWGQRSILPNVQRVLAVLISLAAMLVSAQAQNLVPVDTAPGSGKTTEEYRSDWRACVRVADSAGESSNVMVQCMTSRGELALIRPSDRPWRSIPEGYDQIEVPYTGYASPTGQASEAALSPQQSSEDANWTNHPTCVSGAQLAPIEGQRVALYPLHSTTPMMIIPDGTTMRVFGSWGGWGTDIDLHGQTACLVEVNGQSGYVFANMTRLVSMPKPALQETAPVASNAGPSGSPASTSSDVCHPTQPTTETDREYADVLDKVVAKDAHSWAFNRYDRGSMGSIEIDRSASGTPAKVKGCYTFNKGQPGWVQADFSKGKVVCVRYWDFPADCRPVGEGLGKQIEEAERHQAEEERLERTRWSKLSQGERQAYCRRNSCESKKSQCENNNGNAHLAGALGGYDNPFSLSDQMRDSLTDEDCPEVYRSCMAACLSGP